METTIKFINKYNYNKMDKVVNIDSQDSLSYHDDLSQEECTQQK